MKKILQFALPFVLLLAAGAAYALEYHIPQVNSVTSVPNSYTAASPAWTVANGSTTKCTGFMFYDDANSYDIMYALVNNPTSGNTLPATAWTQYDGNSTGAYYLYGNTTCAHASGLGSYGIWKASWGPYIGNYTLPDSGLYLSTTFTAAGNTVTGAGYMKTHFESWK